MHVSVIMPVYNAASFVSQAVESALQQPETGEVILVEDGSSDNGWEVCRHLASRHERVHLFRHANGENRGPNASRNLAMRNSSCEFISFLDADDYYLPGRFTVAKDIFRSDPACEGVYEAIGRYVEDHVGLERWKRAELNPTELHTMTKRVEPEVLCDALISGRYCDFSVDGLVLKRAVLQKSGYMDERLRMHEDTEFLIRVAIVARLVPGRLDEPVAMWRIHDHNHISAPRSAGQVYQDKIVLWMSVYNWCKARSYTEKQQRILDRVLLWTQSYAACDTHLTRVVRSATARRAIRLTRLLGYPRVIAELAASGKLLPWSMWGILMAR
jgi:glycosyltransferase involved in cell wall biosynthesis